MKESNSSNSFDKQMDKSAITFAGSLLIY